MPNKGLPPVTVFDSDPFGPTVQAVGPSSSSSSRSFLASANLDRVSSSRLPPSSRPSRTSSPSSLLGSFPTRRLSTGARFVLSPSVFSLNARARAHPSLPSRLAARQLPQSLHRSRRTWIDPLLPQEEGMGQLSQCWTFRGSDRMGIPSNQL